MSPTQPQGHRYKAGILGATGTVGQRFLELLSSHPWIEVTRLGASERSSGRKYGEVVKWKLSSELPCAYRDMDVVNCCVEEFVGHCDFVFSGLDASVAGAIESEFAEAGLPVFSNAKNHRYDEFVPILIPFVNPQHLEAVRQQPSFPNSGGFIVTNANCSSTGLSIALAPIYTRFNGIEKLFVSTLQAISGAGYPGLPSLDIIDNVVPFISGEEEKIELEPKKILATLSREMGFIEADIKISSTCHRVAVSDGHVVSISLQLPHGSCPKEQLVDDVVECLNQFSIPDEVAKLPSCPNKAIVVRFESDRPQPRLDRNAGNGMTTVVGRVRSCNLLDLRMTILSHNTIVGAAGGSVLNAELAISKGLVRRKRSA